MSKILVIGESCTDVFKYGYSDRLCPDSPAPVFVEEHQTDNPAMAANVYVNILSILHHKYKKDNDTVKLITNFKTNDYITKTRYVIERNNTTLLRVDVGEKNFCHISEHYSNWKEEIEFGIYDIIVISDYDKGFLKVEDLQYILSKNKNVIIDTKKIISGWANDVLFLKINTHEYNRSKENISPILREKAIVTLGSNGSLYKDEVFPVKNVHIKDPCGAGDSHLAGLVVSYLKTKDIVTSIKFANKMATIVVQKKGVCTPYD